MIVTSVEWLNDSLKSRTWKLWRATLNGITFNLQWNTAISMNVKSAWGAGYTGKGVLVAVVDDGVNMNHPDLVSNFVSILLIVIYHLGRFDKTSLDIHYGCKFTVN